ncbi:MAG TPA: ubiquinol-cytochrome c reductase iron-sulfur subunit [Herpetosiphonaceae bacterium]
MAIESEPRNAGRRIITQAEAEAIAAKARPDQPPPQRKSRLALTRREALVYALAGSSALVLATASAGLVQPDPTNDPTLSAITPEFIKQNVPGGFAYPRFKEGEFGGKFTLAKKANEYTVNDPPDLNATGKFYIVKVAEPVSTTEGVVAQQGVQAIYQVCTHLGCLIPFQKAENRFICPCHGSTFERNSDYVRGPAARNLDQFVLEVGGDGTIVVDTGKRRQGAPA